MAKAGTASQEKSPVYSTEAVLDNLNRGINRRRSLFRDLVSSSSLIVWLTSVKSIVGNRVPLDMEIEGLDVPEMGKFRATPVLLWIRLSRNSDASSFRRPILRGRQLQASLAPFS